MFELYAATPPSERLRIALSDAMNGPRRSDDRACRQLMVCDVSRAKRYAPSIRPAYVAVIKDDWEKGGEDKLNASTYGARDAALNWHEHCRRHLLELGFAQGKASPCIFRRQGQDIKVFTQGDDYVASGLDTNVR